MTHRTRSFLFGSGLIVVVGLCTGLVAFYNGNLPLGRSSRLAEFSYIPSDATAVAYADVRHIMDSEFRQRLREMLPTGQEKERMLAETGIDIERDIDSVIAGFTPGRGPSDGPTIFVRGRFDESRIEAAAVQHGGVAEDYRGRRLLRWQERPGAVEMREHLDDQTPREQAHAVAFLETGLVALGNLDAIRRSIDAYDTNATVSQNAELMKFVNGVVNTGDAWIVGRFDELSGAKLPELVRDQLSSVQWFSLSAAVNQTVTGRLRAQARDPEAAEQLRAIVNGALAVGKLMTSKDKRLEGVLDSVQATGSGSEIEMSFTVPPDVLDVFTSSHGMGPR